MPEIYFENVEEVRFNELGDIDNRPRTTDVVFKFESDSHFRQTLKVRFHGPANNRFITTFPKPGRKHWKEIADGLDLEGVVLTAVAWLECTYGLVGEELGRVPDYIRNA